MPGPTYRHRMSRGKLRQEWARAVLIWKHRRNKASRGFLNEERKLSEALSVDQFAPGAFHQTPQGECCFVVHLHCPGSHVPKPRANQTRRLPGR